jgi:transcriptional antiterminator
MENQYVIEKTLSNNVVLAEKDNKLYVLIGKGIGFGKKKGDTVSNEQNIEQVYVHIEESQREDYNRILKDVDREIVAVCEEVIGFAVKTLGEELNSHIHIGLTDHINFAIARLKDGIKIENPFLFEIKVMYPKEYSIAEVAINLIENRLNIRLPESEIGFIALHIHSARVNQSVGESLKYTSIVKEAVDFIQQEIGVTISEKSFDYTRLISHLKYSLYRIDNEKSLKNVLLLSIKRQLKKEYKIAKKVCDFISQKLGKEVPEDEVGYIAVHLNRLKGEV